MKKEDFDSLQRGMAEAAAFLEGARTGFVTHEPVDVHSVRANAEFRRRERADP